MNARQLGQIVGQMDSGHFDTLLGEGRGVIVAGGHFGNWELGGVALRQLRGYPLSVVGRPEASAAVSVMRRRLRVTLGIETIHIGQMLDTALRIRRVLNQNGVVAMLMDRHLGRDRVDVTFFGRPTGFLRSPAMISALPARQPSVLYDSPAGRSFRGSLRRSDPRGHFRAPGCGHPGPTQAFATQLERIREPRTFGISSIATGGQVESF